MAKQTPVKEVRMSTELQFAAKDSMAELIEVGYEQMDCNEEGLNDFGDAIRILVERKYPTLSQESMALLYTFMEIYCAAGWRNEFKQLEEQ